MSNELMLNEDIYLLYGNIPVERLCFMKGIISNRDNAEVFEQDLRERFYIKSKCGMDGFTLNSANYSGASERLFVGDRTFEKEDVLYRRGGDELNVDGLLKVCGYAVKIAQVVEPDNEFYDKSSAAVSVFKGLELVLNNDGKDSKCAKMLHLANDFLVGVLKPSLVSNGAKSALVGMSLLVDLVIDFFVG
jgi:hypothetical protein